LANWDTDDIGLNNPNLEQEYSNYSYRSRSSFKQRYGNSRNNFRSRQYGREDNRDGYNDHIGENIQIPTWYSPQSWNSDVQYPDPTTTTTTTTTTTPPYYIPYPIPQFSGPVMWATGTPFISQPYNPYLIPTYVPLVPYIYPQNIYEQHPTTYSTNETLPTSESYTSTEESNLESDTTETSDLPSSQDH